MFNQSNFYECIIGEGVVLLVKEVDIMHIGQSVENVRILFVHLRGGKNGL